MCLFPPLDWKPLGVVASLIPLSPVPRRDPAEVWNLMKLGRIDLQAVLCPQDSVLPFSCVHLLGLLSRGQ